VAAPYTNSTLAVGGHLVTATYSGDGSHHPSTSTTLSQFVQGIVADWTFNHAGGTNTPAGLPGGATAGTTAYPLAEGTQFSNGTPVEDTSGERHHGFYSGGASSGYATYLTPSGTAGLRFHPTSGNGLIVRLGRTDRDAGMRANFNYGTSATPNLPYMTPGLNWTIEELVNFDNVSVDASQSQRLFGENEAFTGNNVKYVCYAQNAAGDPANTGIRVELIPNDLSTNTIDAVFNTTAVNDTGWHHLAVLFNRSNQTVSVYLDKVPLTSINGVAGTGLLDISAHAALNIGQATANGLEIGGFLGGAIDRIAISAELLTPSTFVIIPNTFTTVAVGTSANPIDEGGTVTFTATVKTNGITAANAGGTMIFKDGGTALSTNAVSSGVASCGSLGLSAGSHLITATYSGDASYGPNLSQVLTQGVRFATASLITLGSANPLPSNGTGGDPFFNFEVWTNGVLAGDAGGFVTFKEGATVVASGIPVTGGQAFYSTPALLTPGWHYVTAEYSGGSLYQASTSSLPAAQAVYNSATQVATTMALASSANPSTNGDSILLTATVSTNYVDPAAAAAGTVIFKDGPVTLGSRPVSSGVASLPTGPLFAGVHKLTAEYSGDGVYGPTPASLAQTVQARTTLALSSSANPSAVGANVTFTATVQTNGVATATASGAMDFYDGANYVNSAAVLKGVATYTTAMTFGTHWMTAQYNPTTDPIHLASTSQVLTQAVKLATSTLLVSSLNPSTNGNRLTFTATVRTNGVTAADATGTMVFKNGVSLLGSPGVTNGVASFDTSVLPVGTNNLTAEYSGDVTYLASTNAPVLAQVVKSSMPTTGTNLLWSVNGGNLTISWPGYLGWILQQQTNGLNPGLTANWVDMTGTESVTTTNVPLSVVPAAFYRLRHP
jgi:hypothetical protein